MIVCKVCGTRNKRDATFCDNCKAYLEWWGEAIPGVDEPPQVELPAVKPQTPADGPRVSNVPARGVLVSLGQQAAHQVQPGGEVAVDLRVRNTGQIVDRYGATVSGDLVAWCRVDPDPLSLFPGAEGTIHLTFRPPRASTPPAGVSRFSVLVRSLNDSSVSAAESGTIEIGVLSDLSAAITPRTSHGRDEGLHQLSVTNAGNSAVSVTASGSDPDELLSLDIQPSTFALKPDATARANLGVRPRGALPAGRVIPFQIRLKGVGQAPITLDGGFVRDKRSRRPLAVAAGIATVALAAVIVAVMARGGAISPPPPPTNAPTFSVAGAALITPTPVQQTPPPPPPHPVVPPLVGLSEADAKSALIANGLKAGTNGTAYSASVRPGRIIKQHPAAKTRVAAGSAVTYTVSLGGDIIPWGANTYAWAQVTQDPYATSPPNVTLAPGGAAPFGYSTGDCPFLTDHPAQTQWNIKHDLVATASFGAIADGHLLIDVLVDDDVHVFINANELPVMSKGGGCVVGIPIRDSVPPGDLKTSGANVLELWAQDQGDDTYLDAHLYVTN